MVQLNNAYAKMMASVANAKIDAPKAEKSTKCEPSNRRTRGQESRRQECHQRPEANVHRKAEEHAQQRTPESASHRQQKEEKKQEEEEMKKHREKQREETRKRSIEESQRLVFERLKKKGRSQNDIQGFAYRIWSTLEEEYGGGLRPEPGDNRRTLPRTTEQLSFLLSGARDLHSAMFCLQGLFRKVQDSVLKDSQQEPADKFCFATLRSALSQVAGGSTDQVISEDDRLRELLQRDLLSDAALKVDKIHQQGRTLYAKIAKHNGNGIAETVQTSTWQDNIKAIDRLYDAMSQTLEKFEMIKVEVKILQSIGLKKSELGESQRRNVVANFENISKYCDKVWSREFLA